MRNILGLCTRFPAATKLLVDEVHYLKEDYQSYYELPDYTQRKLTGLLLQAMNPTYFFEWIGEHKDSNDLMTMFARALIADENEAYQDVLEHMQNMATDYYAKSLEELFLDEDL